MTKALDILSDSTYPQPDPVAVAFGDMVLSAKRMFNAIADVADQFSGATASVGLNAIEQRYADDPRLVAVKTVIAVLQQQWPQLSSFPLPEIYAEPKPVEVPAKPVAEPQP